MRSLLPLLIVATGVVGCGGGSSGDAGSSATSTGSATSVVESTSSADQRFPDVVDVVAVAGTSGWDFDVTVSSPYDTPERYADAWRIVAPDGAVLGVRELAHDHQFEQPFTRSLRAVEIPVEVSTVVVEGRDSANGWGGATVQVELADR